MGNISFHYYFQRVPQEKAPKDDKVYYYLDKDNHQIIEESVLKKAFDNVYKNSNFIFLPNKKF